MKRGRPGRSRIDIRGNATLVRSQLLPASLLSFAAFTIEPIAQADTPAFDRPGIAFSTTTIPRGSLAVELGMPGFVHEPIDEGTSTTYRLDSNFRTGLSRFVEIELATPLYNYEHTDTGRQSESMRGFGDSSLSLKASLPSRSAGFSWALLAGATFASGAKAFSGGATQYRLATSMDEQLDDQFAAGLYVQLDGASGSSDYLLSPNFDFTASSTLSGYVEAAYSHFSHGSDTSLAGAGVAWMATPILQLDLSFDLGLTHASPKLQGGVGISVYLARL